ncbi:MAG: amidophosphoribosyltransferase [Clostridia bacterium]|nr:amidophosphoribosyltransferase [Clostridia bacterium]
MLNMQNKIHEECGIFGVYSNTGDATKLSNEAYLALFAIQHRGQVSCGIALSNDGNVNYHRGLGLVFEVFTPDVMKKLASNGKADMAIGHVRYSQSGECGFFNSQPLVMRYAKGSMSIANNGKLTNTVEVKEHLEKQGAIFQTNTDAELIAYLVARERLNAGSVENAINNIMKRIQGAYSFVMMSPHKLIAARDPHGFRPLCIGELNGEYIFCSESCALDSIGATFIRDVKPGEIVIADKNGLRSITDNCGQKTSFCVFEYVYFARPDSIINGVSVHLVRQHAGAILAKEYPVDADIVVGVPDSGNDAAIGYANESGIPYGMGFIKNKYIGRTFIQDSQIKRERSVHIKLNPIASAVKGKRVVLIDDSIVRGTTIAKIVRLMRDGGAKEVHVRISSPPFINVCYYGTDINSKEHLIACRMTQEEIRQSIGADTLGYLSINGLRNISHESNCGFCDACFTGEYPTEPPQEKLEDKFARKLESL